MYLTCLPVRGFYAPSVCRWRGHKILRRPSCFRNRRGRGTTAAAVIVIGAVVLCKHFGYPCGKAARGASVNGYFADGLGRAAAVRFFFSTLRALATVHDDLRRSHFRSPPGPPNNGRRRNHPRRRTTYTRDDVYASRARGPRGWGTPVPENVSYFRLGRRALMRFESTRLNSSTQAP